MNVCVQGLWHLGSVTAACLASLGHSVNGLDFDTGVVAGLAQGKAPLHEPGLDDLMKRGIEAGRLQFSTLPEPALRKAAVVWVAYDTPVNESDEADVNFVIERVESLFPHLKDGTIVLISSQLPVGSTRLLADRFAAVADGRHCHFAYSPENLRLGKALSVFLQPDRIVVGVGDDAARTGLQPLLASITDNIVWMDVESAEMTKHAINAFLATSIVFANEIAAVCELVGANAREVARGLKTESRIGPGAYVSPGGPFAGGTLARDITFLTDIGGKRGAHLDLLKAVKPSNDWHKTWTQRQLTDRLGNLSDHRIAILGLTYKPDTDTLRRSAAIELAAWLHAQGATVVAYDPRITMLPEHLAGRIALAVSIESALKNASAAILSINAPEFKSVAWNTALKYMRAPVIIDPNGVLAEILADVQGLYYATVGFTHNGAGVR